MTPARTRRRRALCTVVATAAVVSLSACGSDDKKPDAKPDATSSSPPGPTRHPFTGQLVKDAPGHGSVTVKVDNTDAARPQAGLGGANLVVEELVEGGMTRLAAVYWDELPKEVGPVRSMRTTDIDIVTPTKGLLAASGAARRPTAAIKRAQIRTIVPGGKAFTRDSNRRAPYNLMLDVSALSKSLEDRPVPGDYFRWAAPDAAVPKGKPAKRASVRFSAFHTTDWSFRKGSGWTRQEELAPAGDRYKVENLLVLRVRVRDAGYRDVAGNPVPETVFKGKGGKAWLLRGGQVVDARWSKAGPGAKVNLTGPGGAALPLPVGRTWIELMPDEGRLTVGR